MSQADDLTDLKGLWESATPAIDVDLDEIRRRRRRPLLMIALDGVLGLLGLAVAAWFVITGDGLLFYSGAAVMAAASVIGFWLGWQARRGLLGWANWSPRGTLEFRQQNLVASLRMAQVTRWSGYALFGFSLWVLFGAWAGWLGAPVAFGLAYAAGCGLVAVGFHIGTARYARGKQRELARVREIVAELGE